MTRRRTRRRLRFAGLAGVGAIAVMGVLAAAAPSAEADAFDGTFSTLATAHGLRIQVVVANAPLTNNVLDAGGPSALAVLDSVGDSHAYSSFPFPGEIPATAPGLVRGASGAPVPPDYPFFVASRYPGVPKQEFDAAAVTLRAASSSDVSTAIASAGGAVAGVGMVAAARSEAAARQTEDGVKSSATSEISGLNIGPLQIGQILSSAEVELSVDGAVKRSADTRIIGAMVNDVPVTISSGGVVVQKTSVPGTAPAPVADALSRAGIRVEIAPMRQSENGVNAPAVRITRDMGSGQSIVLTLGGASAALQGAGAPSAGSAGSTTGHTAGGVGAADAAALAPKGPAVEGAAASPTDSGSIPTAPDLSGWSGGTAAPPPQAGLIAPNTASAGSERLATERRFLEAAFLMRSSGSWTLWAAMAVAPLCAVGIIVGASRKRIGAA